MNIYKLLVKIMWATKYSHLYIEIKLNILLQELNNSIKLGLELQINDCSITVHKIFIYVYI